MFEEIIELEKQNRVADALDLLMDTFDDLILDGNVNQAKTLLQGFIQMPDSFSSSVLLGVISITRSNAMIEENQELARIVYRRSEKTHGKEYADSLMQGLLIQDN